MTEQTQNTTGIYEALAKAQGSFPSITKNRTANVGTYSYTYADLSDIVAAVKESLSTNGLSFTQSVVMEGTRTVLRSSLHHASGQIHSDIPFTAPNSNKPQEMGSALTYARRYGLCALLGIVAEEDDDGQAAQKGSSNTRSAPATKPAAAPAAKKPAPPTKLDEERARRAGFDSAAKQASFWKMIWAKAKSAGLTETDLRSWIENHTKPKKESTKDLTWVEANQLKKAIEAEAMKIGSDEDIANAARESGEEG